MQVDELHKNEVKLDAFKGENTTLAYYVMPRYGKNLDRLFTEHKHRFSLKTVLQIGIQLVDILDRIHTAGYTYNDLKLDNIVIGDSNFSEYSLHEIHLVDFGFA